VKVCKKKAALFLNFEYAPAYVRPMSRTNKANAMSSLTHLVDRRHPVYILPRFDFRFTNKRSSTRIATIKIIKGAMKN